MNVRTTRHMRAILILVLMVLLCWRGGIAAELRLGQATVPPGGAVSVPLTSGGVTGAVAAQFDVRFDPSLVRLAGISGGNSLAGHIVDQQELAPGHWRALAYSTNNGPIDAGTVVLLNFTVPTNAPDGVVPLNMSNAILATAAGQPVQPLSQISGAITITSAEHLTAVPLEPGGRLRLTVLGLPGRAFKLQGSPDLFHWAHLGTLTNQTGTLVLTNLPPTGRDAYFYRTMFLAGTNPAVPAPSLSDFARLLDGRVRVQLNSITDSAWRFEGSPDLVHWGNYGLVTNASGMLAITNAPFRKPETYFYRAAQP